MPIVIFLIWYILRARNNPKTYNSIEGKIGKIITFMVILSVLSSFIQPLLFLSIAIIVLLAIFSPVIIVGGLISKVLGIGGKKEKNNPQVASTYQSNGNLTTGLTKSVPKRRKIIQKFNKKYKLTLTDEEIARIVEASYMSFAWEKEIFDMQQEYDTISQWYNSNTNWLRAYLRVFPVQSVSSDFARQRQICMETFAQIFDEVNPSAFGTLDDCISVINERYFSYFDETTFMIAYRFLESCGKHYDLPSMGIIRNESELDKLRRKYDESVAVNPESALGNPEFDRTRRTI